MWRDLLRNINSSEGIIIAGDFNAHSVSWNCEETDRIGDNTLKYSNYYIRY